MQYAKSKIIELGSSCWGYLGEIKNEVNNINLDEITITSSIKY